MTKRLTALLFALILLAAACGDDDGASDAAGGTDDEMADDDMADDDMADVATGPASITAQDQSGDGSTVTVDSVTLPTDGFVVIHADDGGAAGAILGWSELLPAGETTDVVVTLNMSVDASADLWPMAHIDANGNGVYEFMPPDVLHDVPATTADGTVAATTIGSEVAG